MSTQGRSPSLVRLESGFVEFLTRFSQLTGRILNVLVVSNCFYETNRIYKGYE